MQVSQTAPGTRDRLGRRSAPGTNGRLCDSGLDDRVKDLVAAAQAGDRDAMGDLYARFAPGVRAYVSRIVGRQEAEDVTQQVFLKLLCDLPRYHPRQAPFSAWLLRVAHNLAVDHRRRSRAVPVAEVYATHEGSHDVQRDSIESLVAALRPLTHGQREVLILQDLAGLTPHEIADRMGRSVHSVHCLHHRARSAARAALDHVEGPATPGRPTVPDEAWRDIDALIAA